MVLMGLREYARSRKERGLPGGTLAAVQKAIKSGRIAGALYVPHGGKMIPLAQWQAIKAGNTGTKPTKP